MFTNFVHVCLDCVIKCSSALKFRGRPHRTNWSYLSFSSQHPSGMHFTRFDADSRTTSNGCTPSSASAATWTRKVFLSSGSEKCWSLGRKRGGGPEGSKSRPPITGRPGALLGSFHLHLTSQIIQPRVFELRSPYIIHPDRDLRTNTYLSALPIERKNKQMYPQILTGKWTPTTDEV